MGIRIIKTAIAAIIAIYVAVYFELELALSAGILAILSVEVTMKKGLSNSFARFVASVLGLLLASAIFFFLGFYYWTVAIFILVAFPILSKFQLKEGIVTSAVIVFHLYSFGEVTISLLWNEVCLLLVGLGTATVINMFFMPKDETSIQQFKQSIEQNFCTIFEQLAMTLKDPSHVWSGKEFLLLGDDIIKGSAIANRYRENRLFHYEVYWITYFEMRRQQLEFISDMMEKVALIHDKHIHGELVAELLEQLGKDTKSDVYVGNVKEKLVQLEGKFRTMPLPVTREEFETRAALLMLMHEMNGYLDIASRLKRRKDEADQQTK